MKRFLLIMAVALFPSLLQAAVVVLNADNSFKGNYITFYAFIPSKTSPSQNYLFQLGQIGPINLNSAGQDPIPSMQNAGITESNAKIQVNLVMANTTQNLQTYCSTAYYDFSFPTTINFDATHSYFVPGPCAAEITNIM